MLRSCRLCAAALKSNFIVIEDEQSELCQQLRTLFQVDVRLGDPLPKFVCGECVCMMQTLFMFYIKVQKAQESLKALLEVPTSKCIAVKVEDDENTASEVASDGGRAKLPPDAQESLNLEFNNTCSEHQYDDEQVGANPLQGKQEFLDLKSDNGEQAVGNKLATDGNQPEATVSPRLLPISKEAITEVRRKSEESGDTVKMEIFIDTEQQHAAIQDSQPCNADSTTICESEAVENPPEAAVRPRLLSKVRDSRFQLQRQVRSKTERKREHLIGKKKQGKSLTKTRSLENLQRHSKTSDGKEQPHKCDICCKSFMNIGMLNRHMLIHTGEKPFQCSICDKSFVYRFNLKSHMIRHTGEHPHQCSVCLRAFTDKSTLNAHMSQHTGERPFKCSLCESAFAVRGNLNTHMKQHAGERPYQCTVCESNFTNKFYLKTHMRQHTGERPFQCSICERTFAVKACLKVHMRQHTGERPYKCSICSMVFTQKGTLDGHMRRHTGERPFQCSICERTFAVNSALKVHMRRHTGERPYKCSQCTMVFTQKGSLDSHMSQHTGERPFQCAICERNFPVKSSLRLHMRLHTGERPYKCSQCTMVFTQKGSLNKHMRRHTGERGHKFS